MISIIIPVYNVEKYLQKCLESIKNQTFKDIEVILVNDGSTDDSVIICEQFVKNDNRFKLINKENGGPSSARNIALSEVNTPYLTFVDSDDWLDLDMIELLYKELVNHDADISACGYFVEEVDRREPVWDSGITEIWNRKEALTKLIINEEMKDFSCAKLYKTDLFKDLEFPKGMYFEDIYLMYKIFNKAKKVVKVSIPKYHYYQHGNNITSNKTKNIKKELDFFNALTEQYHFVMNDPNIVLDEEIVKNKIAVMQYRSKKQMLQRFSLFSNEYKILRNQTDLVFKNIFFKTNILKIGILRYLGAIILLYVPLFFEIIYKGKR